MEKQRQWQRSTRRMVNNDSKYLETVNFYKYLVNYMATKKAICYDIGSQGTTYAVEDERSAATIM